MYNLDTSEMLFIPMKAAQGRMEPKKFNFLHKLPKSFTQLLHCMAIACCTKTSAS